MILLGTSLGSSVAVHFAREHPECVKVMALCGPQVYVDGIGIMQKFPRFLAGWGVQASTRNHFYSLIAPLHGDIQLLVTSLPDPYFSSSPQFELCDAG